MGVAACARVAACALVAACSLVAGPGVATAEDAEATEAPHHYLWVSPAELAPLPTTGLPWRSLRRYAVRFAAPDLSDQNDPANVYVLAKALVYARTGEAKYRDSVVQACMAAIGSERGAWDILALSRELATYVIAADLVGLPEEEDGRFRKWLREMRTYEARDRTIVSAHEDRPNNWGTHAGASRLAVAAYLGDREDFERGARVFRAWLGERELHPGFQYGGLSWQADRDAPVAINPKGATHYGHSIDGVLPDDQRRGGGFSWPPVRENYVYEGLQGALLQALLLASGGYEDVWQWSDRALLRAFRWLHDEADYPTDGDDTWMPHVINHVYGTSFPAPIPSQPGKALGFTDWVYGERE